MRSLLLVGGAGLLCMAFGCSSEDSPSGASKAGANAGGSATTGGDKATGGAKATGGDKASGGAKATGGAKTTGGDKPSDGGKASGGTSPGGAGKGGSGESGGDSGGALSAACKMYCECHELNCATQSIPGDQSCGDFCTAMTADQLACRQNMCGLVPAQPDNDHCRHSVGINQCL